MKTSRYQILFAVLFAAAAGVLGAVAAERWFGSDREYGLHDFVHNELSLSPTQETKLDEIERKFATEQMQLEFSLRAANARLAQAMEQEHKYGPEVAAAIDEVHERMGDVQKVTVRHVFAMRIILTPAQQRAFDRQVSDALTSAPRE
jgi:Spy/CpxP family protein refolding chaperone